MRNAARKHDLDHALGAAFGPLDGLRLGAHNAGASSGSAEDEAILGRHGSANALLRVLLRGLHRLLAAKEIPGCPTGDLDYCPGVAGRQESSPGITGLGTLWRA